MSEKTALELVYELQGRLAGGCLGAQNIVDVNLAHDIKSAIERERDASEIAIDGLEELVKSNTRTIQDLTEQLKSAIVMRPISELPDKVPDGCMIVAVGKLRVTIKCWVWEPGDDVFPHEGETHFYILPLPKPARRLHPCYMPGCGGAAESISVEGTSWRVKCLKCGALGSRRKTQQESKDAWGYAE